MKIKAQHFSLRGVSARMHDDVHRKAWRYILRCVGSTIMLFGFWMSVLVAYQILGPKIAEEHFTLYNLGLAFVAAVTIVWYVKRAVDRYQSGEFLED